jgi:hypothetical protein
MSKNYFKAQALAIVMVVLVVASIIGVSLFSRMSKDRQAAIDEQNSAVAAELSDTILDVVVNADIDVLESYTSNPAIESLADLKTFMEDPPPTGLGISLTNLDFPSDATWCPPEENSTFRFSIELLDSNEAVEVRPGDVVAYHLQGATVGASCVLPVTVGTNEEIAVFAVKTVYDDGTEPALESYCLNQSGSCNHNDIEDSGANITILPANTDLLENFDLTEPNLAEIRILGIKGNIAVTTGDLSPDESCIDRQFKYIKVNTEANCNGSYRAKEMILPGSGNLGYSSLFDYGVYDNARFILKH